MKPRAGRSFATNSRWWIGTRSALKLFDAVSLQVRIGKGGEWVGDRNA